MSLRGNRAIGILREVKNKWERRAPLTPDHVAELVKRGVKVYIQPSGRRVYADVEYSRAGAIVQDDLTPASVIMGVKEVPPENLIPDRTYTFFSHVIKAQPYNMPLLDAVLEKNIRLIDYECIVEGGKRGGDRLVAFGRYAGIAGMIDTTRGLGERLLSLGLSTPFLNISNTFMYKDLESARRAVHECGQHIAANGTPASLGPLTFGFTGTGKVAQGSREIFELLPHEMVSASDLPELVKPGAADLSKVYGVQITAQDMVEHQDGKAFDKAHYYANPEEYNPTFHRNVAPHLSVLMNCMYWDAKFPRLLTKEQTEDLSRAGRLRMLALGDISCDPEGSVEFFSHSTEIENPFYLYDPEAHVTHNNMDDHGILVQGVENLPAQLPREASQSFGDALLPFVEKMSSSDGTLPFDRQTDLPAEMHGAAITDHGSLTPNFKYISELRHDRERLAARLAASSGGGASDGRSGVDKRLLLLRGHLFDYSLINRMLDLVESSPCDFRLVNCVVGSDRNEATQAVFELVGDEETLDDVHRKMSALSDNMSEVAKTTLRALPFGSSHVDAEETTEFAGAPAGPSAEDLQARLPISVRDMGPKKVLVLGAGLVAGPVIDYLHRIPGCNVTIAAADMQEAKMQVGGRSRIIPTQLDVTTEEKRMAGMMSEHDIAISLVPATFHTRVAKACLSNKKPLVTASYVSDDMRAMDADARKAGVPFLCELGLDPGIDHMSAKRLIDEVHDEGAKVESFESYCGGLPAPEATTNPLGYKFSWSPRGVLLAGKNNARFLVGGQEMAVDAAQLFRSARPLSVLPSLSIEALPNRNSIPYQRSYDIPEAHTVFRGTLRYAGFSNVMHTLRELGYLEEAWKGGAEPETWAEAMRTLVPGSASDPAARMRERLAWTETSDQAAAHVMQTMEFLGLFSDKPFPRGKGPMDGLCDAMLQRMQYGPEERDMVLMHHRLMVRHQDGHLRRHLSTMLAYGVPGGDSAMATTVGLPAAIGAALILDGTIAKPGVHIPVAREVYNPIMNELDKEGVRMVETSEIVE